MPVKQPRRLSKGDGTTKQIVEHHKAVHCTLEFPGLQEGSNYSACLSQFAENKLVYESAWTEHGNVKEHTLCPSLKEFLLDTKFPYDDELESIREVHNNRLPF